MNTANIEVSFVNQPAEGKKMGNLKLKDGSFYLVSPTMLSQFKPGGSYEITYEARDYNGKEFRTIKTVKAPSTNGAAGTAAPSAGRTPDNSEDIFVAGICNNLAGAGQLDTSAKAIESLTSNLRLGYRAGRYPKAAPAQSITKAQSEDEMNDEIPF